MSRGGRAAVARPLVVAGAAVLALVACGGGVAGGSGTPITIGLLTEQTGSFSWYGTESVQGAQLYADQVNASGGLRGRKVRIVTYDTGSQPQNAILGFKQLTQRDHVQAVMGLGLITEALAVAPLAGQQRVVTYAIDGAFKPSNPWTFDGVTYIADMQRRVGEWMRDQQHYQRVAFLATNDAGDRQNVQIFKGIVQQEGMATVDEQYFNATDLDVTGQLEHIMAQKPDVIVSWVLGKPLGVVFRSAHQLGIDKPFITSYGNLAPGFLKSLAAVQPPQVYVISTKDTFWATLPRSDTAYDRVEGFYDAYKKRFGQDTGLGSAAAYDGAKVLATAIANAGSNDPDKIRSALEGVRGLQGVEGTFSFSPSNHVGLSAASAVMGVVQNGELSVVKT
jgi:branched-chain amino acid transport system substrate-binding protein